MRHDLIRLFNKSVHGSGIRHGKLQVEQFFFLYAHFLIAENAVEKGAGALLMPVACRRLLFDLSDDMAPRVDIQFYSDARDALLKSIVE